MVCPNDSKNGLSIQLHHKLLHVDIDNPQNHRTLNTSQQTPETNITP